MTKVVYASRDRLASLKPSTQHAGFQAQTIHIVPKIYESKINTGTQPREA